MLLPDCEPAACGRGGKVSIAYSEAAAERLRAALKGLHGISEKKMFGGICFLLRGNMLCGIGNFGFMFRVGKEQEAAALKRPGARPFDITGKRLDGLVHVRAQGRTARELRAWAAMARKFVGALPAK